MRGAQEGGQRRWRTAASRRSGRVHEGPPPGQNARLRDRIQGARPWSLRAKTPGNSHCALKLPYTRRLEAWSADLVRATPGYGSTTSFQVGSGSYSVAAAASSAVSSPRFFSYTRPC